MKIMNVLLHLDTNIHDMFNGTKIFLLRRNNAFFIFLFFTFYNLTDCVILHNLILNIFVILYATLYIYIFTYHITSCFIFNEFRDNFLREKEFDYTVFS